MIIVIGASLGGFQALNVILAGLPSDFSTPIAVVLHRSRESDDYLSLTLQRHTSLKVIEVVDKEPIRPGCLYIGPPDYHLLVEEDYFSLSMDEPVNYARPAIDVLFDSAADVNGSSAIGVILTGSGHDGAEGAAQISNHGGTVIIQDPHTAECGLMPSAALQAVPTAEVKSLEQIPLLLNELTHRKLAKNK